MGQANSQTAKFDEAAYIVGSWVRFNCDGRKKRGSAVVELAK